MVLALRIAQMIVVLLVKGVPIIAVLNVEQVVVGPFVLENAQILVLGLVQMAVVNQGALILVPALVRTNAVLVA